MKREETGRKTGEKNWNKKKIKDQKRLDDTERSSKKQEETVRNSKKQ